MWTEHYRPAPVPISPAVTLPVPASVTSAPHAVVARRPRRQPAVVSAIGQFAYAHPVLGQVFVMLLAFAVMIGVPPLGFVLWIVGAIVIAVWRHALVVANGPLRKVRAAERAREPRETRGSVTRREPAAQLKRAAAQLHGVDLGVPLVEQIEVAGEIHHIKDIRRVYAAAGKTITASGSTLNNARAMLCPEPWNAADSNAVAVMVGIYHVGYLPWDIGVDYAVPLLRLAQEGQGVMCEARIWAKLEDGAVRARVTLLAPEADALS